MAGARHAAPPARGALHRGANTVCTAVVVVGVATVLLAGRASGSADGTGPSGGVLSAGRAVVPDGLYPGAVVTGRLPVTNPGAADAQVTGVVFEPPVADAGHRACRTRDVVLTASSLPVVPRAKARSIAFTVSMSRATGNGCQGATFTSRYRVTTRPV